MPKTSRSQVFLASPRSDSLKTTVPISVATVLGLEPKDALNWEVDVASRSARVTRLASDADTPEPKSVRRRG